MSRLGVAELAERLTALVDREGDQARVARAVAEVLPGLLANPEALSPDQREPGREGYRQHVLHVDPAGRFSVLSLVWAPGQATPPHDHIAWCVVGVYQGEERETHYRLVEQPGRRPRLEPAGVAIHRAGEVSWLTTGRPNIHRVDNPADRPAISVHVYGADIGRAGSSIRRRFDDLEVRRFDDAEGRA